MPHGDADQQPGAAGEAGRHLRGGVPAAHQGPGQEAHVPGLPRRPVLLQGCWRAAYAGASVRPHLRQPRRHPGRRRPHDAGRHGARQHGMPSYLCLRVLHTPCVFVAWSRHTMFTPCRVVRCVFVPQGAEYIFPVKAKGTHLLVCVGAMENASSKRHSLRSENDAKQGNGRRKASGSASPGGYSNHTWMSVQSLCVLNGLQGTLLVVVCVATLTGVWCLVAVGTCPTQLRRHTLRRASSCTPTCACPATTCASAR